MICVIYSIILGWALHLTTTPVAALPSDFGVTEVIVPSWLREAQDSRKELPVGVDAGVVVYVLRVRNSSVNRTNSDRFAASCSR